MPTLRQVREYAHEIKSTPIGQAWAMIVPVLREAAVDAKVLDVVCGSEQPVRPADVQALREMLRREMSL
jgi:hypothetical protein